MVKMPLVQNFVGKNSIISMGWCGLGHVKSLDDFDGLDVTKSQFLKPYVSPSSLWTKFC